jgi:hypothetical protein
MLFELKKTDNIFDNVYLCLDLSPTFYFLQLHIFKKYTRKPLGKNFDNKTLLFKYHFSWGICGETIEII